MVSCNVSFLVMWLGCSILEAPLEVDMPYYTCYRFIRTVMERLTSSSALDNAKLRIMVEADEFYIKSGLKGRPYNKYIMNSGRLPKHGGLKPWKGRGTFDKERSLDDNLYSSKG